MTIIKNWIAFNRNVLKPLTKSVLILLGLAAAAASAADAAIHIKMFGSGFRTLIISNEEMNDIMKIVKSFEESGLLIKGVSQTIKNETKEQKGGFLSMFLGFLKTTDQPTTYHRPPTNRPPTKCTDHRPTETAFE